MTRADAAIGDNRNFNQTLFNQVSTYLQVGTGEVSNISPLAFGSC